MRKIPTLFVRDPADMSRVTDEVHPDCAWVAAGEGVATRKLDGTSCLFDGEAWWKRREVKAGKAPPPDFREETHDAATGKRTGWVPVTDGDRWHREAIESRPEAPTEPGTYELLGPKVQGNPEGEPAHVMRAHAEAPRMEDAPRDRVGLERWLDGRDVEGIVWHHEDGRMAKIKLRDFGLRRGASGSGG